MIHRNTSQQEVLIYNPYYFSGGSYVVKAWLDATAAIILHSTHPQQDNPQSGEQDTIHYHPQEESLFTSHDTEHETSPALSSFNTEGTNVLTKDQMLSSGVDTLETEIAIVENTATAPLQFNRQIPKHPVPISEYEITDSFSEKKQLGCTPDQALVGNVSVDFGLLDELLDTEESKELDDDVISAEGINTLTKDQHKMYSSVVDTETAAVKETATLEETASLQFSRQIPEHPVLVSDHEITISLSYSENKQLESIPDQDLLKKDSVEFGIDDDNVNGLEGTNVSIKMLPSAVDTQETIGIATVEKTATPIEPVPLEFSRQIPVLVGEHIHEAKVIPSYPETEQQESTTDQDLLSKDSVDLGKSKEMDDDDDCSEGTNVLTKDQHKMLSSGVDTLETEIATVKETATLEETAHLQFSRQILESTPDQNLLRKDSVDKLLASEESKEINSDDDSAVHVPVTPRPQGIQECIATIDMGDPSMEKDKNPGMKYHWLISA